ncbi:MAG: PEFG-CTERM sorting domain-containing protein [Nitrosopumilaceae archaeon]|jgi:predicted secreted protein with PEFG-CTERM motif
MKTILLISLGVIFCSIGSFAYAQEPVFEIWPTQSEVSYPYHPTIEFTINPAPSGPFDAFELNEFDETLEERVPENRILVVYSITNPDGTKNSIIGHYYLEDIIRGTTKASFGTPTKGEYSINAQIFWKTNSQLFNFSSNIVTVTAKEPVFRGVTDEITIDFPQSDPIPLDWSADNQILFRYTQKISAEKGQQNLATITPEGDDLTTLSIPDITEDHRIFDAQFSPNGKSVHMILDNRNLYEFDLESGEIIQLTSAEEVYDFDYYHYREDDPEKYSIIVSVENQDLEDSDLYALLDIGDGLGQNSILDAHALVFNFESSQFDISPDGKKILFKRTLDSSFPPTRVLAYQPAQGEIVEVPSRDTNCGSEPKWAPNGEMIIHISSGCSRGPPGGTMHLTTVDGKYHEILLPYNNNSPRNFAFSPDGMYMVYAMDENLGIMTLATPVPEFGTFAMVILLISVMSVIIVFKSERFRINSL